MMFEAVITVLAVAIGTLAGVRWKRRADYSGPGLPSKVGAFLGQSRIPELIKTLLWIALVLGGVPVLLYASREIGSPGFAFLLLAAYFAILLSLVVRVAKVAWELFVSRTPAVIASAIPTASAMPAPSVLRAASAIPTAQKGIWKKAILATALIGAAFFIVPSVFSPLIDLYQNFPAYYAKWVGSETGGTIVPGYTGYTKEGGYHPPKTSPSPGYNPPRGSTPAAPTRAYNAVGSPLEIAQPSQYQGWKALSGTCWRPVSGQVRVMHDGPRGGVPQVTEIDSSTPLDYISKLPGGRAYAPPHGQASVTVVRFAGEGCT